jgi:hypothetical protein
MPLASRRLTVIVRVTQSLHRLTTMGSAGKDCVRGGMSAVTLSKSGANGSGANCDGHRMSVPQTMFPCDDRLNPPPLRPR